MQVRPESQVLVTRDRISSCLLSLGSGFIGSTTAVSAEECQFINKVFFLLFALPMIFYTVVGGGVGQDANGRILDPGKSGEFW